MKQTKTLRMVLWFSAFFMEITALLFFFGTGWQVINELAGANATVFGVEFLAGAVLFTIGALLKRLGKLLIGLLAGISSLLSIYFLQLLLSQSWSVWATEILIADTLFTLVTATVLFVQLKNASIKETNVYAS